MGSPGHTLQIDLPRDWVNLARSGMCGGGWPAAAGGEVSVVWSCVGGLSFEFCVFVIDWGVLFGDTLSKLYEREPRLTPSVRQGCTIRNSMGGAHRWGYNTVL